MIYGARFRKAARLEYDAAASWYESKRRGLGRDFVDAVDKSMGAIREAPNRYRVILGDVRCVHVGHFPYSIYFRVRSIASLCWLSFTFGASHLSYARGSNCRIERTGGGSFGSDTGGSIVWINQLRLASAIPPVAHAEC